MGNTFEIHVWGWFMDDLDPDKFGHQYQSMWRGESFIRALLEMRRLKKMGYGCVRLEWR